MNPITAHPTNSFVLTLKTSDGFEVAKNSDGLSVTNDAGFPLKPYHVDIRPRSFKADQIT